MFSLVALISVESATDLDNFKDGCQHYQADHITMFIIYRILSPAQDEISDM